MQKNTEKLTDKAFLRLMITSICGMLLCMAMLCSTTWAWFADDVIEKKNQIIPAQGNLEIEIVRVDANGTAVTFDENMLEAMASTGLDLGSGEYTVTLHRPLGSSSGYFVLKWNGIIYYSDCLIYNPEADSPESASFRIRIPDGVPAQRVIIEVRWGIYSGDPMIKKMIEKTDGTVEIPVFELPVVVSDPDENVGGADGGEGTEGTGSTDNVGGVDSSENNTESGNGNNQ